MQSESVVFKDYPDFTPSLTPRQMFEMGVFGGTYWRSIHSGITGKIYNDQQYKKYDFLRDLPVERMCSPMEQYDVMINYFGIRASSPLELWEEKHWIIAQDPYGWVQWYCEFFSGRRSADDARQIGRWNRIAGARGRFRVMLLNRLNALEPRNRMHAYPKLRQVMLHWAVLV